MIVAATMAFAPLLRRIGPSLTDSLEKIKTLPTWRLKLVRKGDEDLLPSSQHQSYPRPKGEKQQQYDDDDDELPMPKPTAMWHNWPVDLDVNSMSVTTTTVGSRAVTKTTVSTSTRTSTTVTGGSRTTWSRSAVGGTTRGGGGISATQVVVEDPLEGALPWPPREMMMVSHGTQTLGRVVVEMDLQGLPYGARL